MTDPLDGIRAKLSRAKTIIDDLNGHLDTFAKNEPYRVIVKEDLAEDDWLYGTFTAVRNPSAVLHPHTIFMAAEVLYHLRSSLDHLVCQLVRLKDPGFDIESPSSLQFPIFKSRGEYKSRAGRMIRGVSPCASSLIEREQPYNRTPQAPSDDVLWWLRELNNTDKHRMIPVTIVAFDTASAYAGDQVEFEVVDAFSNGFLKLEEDKVGFFRYRRERADEKIEAKLACSVVFQQCQLSWGFPRKLEELPREAWEAVSDIVYRFSKEVSGLR